MNETNGYHHGQIIRAFRQKKGWSISDLSEHWPSRPVSWRYVQRVETGEKQIVDQQTLRALAKELDIPLWHFGLSDYNPFTIEQLPGRGDRMFTETMDIIEQSIEQTWYMRRVAPIPETVKNTVKLMKLFEHFTTYLPPPTRLEKRFLRSLAQVRRLQAIMFIEQQRYTEALQAFQSMHRIAQELNEPKTLAMALMGIGTELERTGEKYQAIIALEEARDQALRTSRQLITLVSAYLARAYASNHDTTRFYRTIDTAQSIADNLGDRYGDGTDYVFHRMSGILAERSYGYVDIGEPQKTLAMHDDINSLIDLNKNTWLYAWIPLDWARAFLMLGEVEESINAGREFCQRVQLLQSPHAMSHMHKFTQSLKDQGYNELPIVQSFYKEVQQFSQNTIIKD